MGVKPVTYGPGDVRALRGARSRAAFAALLGVSPLTVYRWELPDGAPQARRPRGKVAARLAAGVEPGDAEVPPPLPGDEALDALEQTEILPLLERLVAGDLRRVESELLGLMASGRLRTLAGRATASQALARAMLLARADTCGAFAILAPLLPDLPRLPGFVELQVHVTAALVFSFPDGRFFDVGKTNAHLARAERLLPRFGTPEMRFLVALVQVTRALSLAAPDGMAEALSRAAELEHVLASPVLSALLRELEGHAAAYLGRRASAEAAYRDAAERGACAASRVRALAQLAVLSIQDARPPHDALALIERAQREALEARLQPGLHSLMLHNLQGVALNRLARYDDAARSLEEAIALASELRWTSVYSVLMLARTRTTLGDVDALRSLGERLSAYEGPTVVALTRGLGAWLTLAAETLSAPEGGAAGDALVAQLDELQRVAGWPDLRGEVLLLAAILLARSGSGAQAGRVLRWAERHFERFPSVLATALIRRSRGQLLARTGRVHEARQLLESAAGTLALAEDVGDAAYARFLLAQLDARGAAGLAQDASRAELEALGFRPAALGELASIEVAEAAVASPCRLDVERLAVQVQRLAARGMSPPLIQRELVTVAAEHLPGAEVRLEELDSTGQATLLSRLGPSSSSCSAPEWVELSDGAGRRLRLGASGAGAEARPALVALACVAELALELATLRQGGQRPAIDAAGPAGEVPDIPGFVSVSPVMRRLKADLARLSISSATVIITGESGSGKEVIARAIHELSTRRGGPYVPFNCAAVPRDLFEGQLFGYRRGAFTGATSDHPGVLRAADGGTVLLDEIGELPLDVQPKLLRFLENGEILPLGERKPVRLDVRVLAATYRDLEELVRERRFREDLFYRLQVVPLHVPPLRERPDDIVALARHFLAALSPPGREPPALAPDALAALHAHAWPGNVRELKNVITRSLAFAPLPPVLGAEHLRLGTIGARGARG